jgi:hypothetical protein
MAFDKTKFFAATKPETEAVDVPGFGTVTVRGLTGAEYDRFEAACGGKGEDGKPAYKTDRALMARLAVVDPETGAAVFGDEDLPALRAEPVKVLAPIVAAAFRLCGLGAGDDAGN